ncbi:zeta toxin family protein [Curtobacterium citreum]
MPPEYELDPPTLNRIFEQQILPVLFGEDTPSSNPLLILVGAQPGAGKTRAGEAAIREAGGDIADIIGDDLRAYHPQYRRLVRNAPATMPAATQQASSAWVEKAIDYAVQHRRSVLVEGTFRRPAVTLDTAQRFKDAGFRVEAVLVAVAPEVSHSSIASRYVEDRKGNGYARFTPVEAHDVSFAALPATIRALAAAESPVDRIVVRSRDGLLLDHTRTPGRGIKGALTVARLEWDRPRTQDELESWKNVANDAIDYFDMNLPGDKDVINLTAQLRLDEEYLDLRADGSIVVRGHLREGYPVRPHVRRPPRRY